ncbi:MAG: glutaredoxin family protein [Gammaproteobacteria bacterium]|nr:MAG: glutaredoxin family protein [Gammaproteobacteria bacterium]
MAHPQTAILRIRPGHCPWKTREREVSKLAVHHFAGLVFGLGLLIPAGGARAATVIECVDAEGRHSFQDHCPVGTREVRKLRIGPERKKEPEAPDLEQLAADHPITLYAVPDCEACDLVRQYLRERNLPFTERDASSDVAVQTDLKALAGTLTVPVLSVDDKVIKGYNSQLLDVTLSQIGYPTSPPPAAKAAGEPPLPPPPPPPAP